MSDDLPPGWSVEQEPPDLGELTAWAVEARYPGEWPEATWEDARRAVALARAVYDCIVRDFEQRGVKLKGG